MSKLKFYIIFCGAAFFFLSLHAHAQTIKTRLSRNKIHIGEQVKLDLIVDGAKLNTSWFQFPDSINHFEVVQRSKIDTTIKAGRLNYHQAIVLTSFDSGRWEFPSLAIAGIQQVTSAFYIDVMPVDVSKLKDYNEIKEIEEVEPFTNWLLIAIVAALVVLIALITWGLIKRKKKTPKRISKNNQTPLQWALKELEKLDITSLQTPPEVKKFYSELTRISRTFFDMQLQQKTFHKTTDEWMTSLQSLAVDNEIKTLFFQFLRLADTVKFAKYLPPEKEFHTSMQSTKLMIEKVSLIDSSVHSTYQPKKN